MALRTYVSTNGNYGSTLSWVEGAVPIAADDVIIASGNITTGLDQSAVTLGGFTVLSSYSGTIGSQGARLKVAMGTFVFAGSGKAWIDIGASAITPRIIKTATAPAGQHGLDLIGSAMTGARIEAGSVVIAGRTGETATVATVQNFGGSVKLGPGCTLTTVNQNGGSTEIDVACTTINADSGTVTTSGSGAITTINNNGATIISNSTGTVTTWNQNKGTADFLQNRTARTITSFVFVGGTVKLDSSVVTITNKIANSGHQQITAQTA